MLLQQSVPHLALATNADDVISAVIVDEQILGEDAVDVQKNADDSSQNIQIDNTLTEISSQKWICKE